LWIKSFGSVSKPGSIESTRFSSARHCRIASFAEPRHSQKG
jgi:hypothetical protein